MVKLFGMCDAGAVKRWTTSVISSFRREVDEDCVLLGCYAGSGGNFLPTFPDNLSVPSSGVVNPWTR